MSLGLLSLSKEDTFIVNGDIVFDDNYFKYFSRETNQVLHTKTNKNDIGVLFDKDENVARLTYGYKYKWAHTIFLKKTSIDFVTKYSYSKKNNKKFAFEIVNIMIDNGYNFNTFLYDGYLCDVDNIQELKNANKHYQLHK